MSRVPAFAIYWITKAFTWSIAVAEESHGSYGKPLSYERQACKVNRVMQSRVFPPEKYKDNAVKMAAVLPVVKDVHVRIGHISIEEIDMRIHVYRKSDSTFNFKITGREQPLGASSLDASLKLFLQDVRFSTPNEKWAAIIAKGVAKVESFVTSFGRNMHTTQLKQVPVRIKLAMSADFEVDGDGAWAIVEGSAKHDVDIDLGNGHPLLWLVNEMIDGIGGMDQVFFDRVWPMVKMLIPPYMGSAFLTVPVSAGGISLYADISGQCVLPGDRGCGSDETKLRIELGVSVDAELENIVKRLATNSSSSESFMGSVYERLASSYDKGLDIRGSGFFGADVVLDPSHAVGAVASPNFALQMPVVSSFLGDQIENLLPKKGDLTAFVGGLRVESGQIFLDEVDLANLKLPVSADEAISIDKIHLEDVVMELDDESSSDQGGGGVFSSQSPFSIFSNSIEFKLGRKHGLRVAPVLENGWQSSSAFVVTVMKEFVNDALVSVGKSLQVPGNARARPEDEADGVLPAAFQPPLPEKRAFLDVGSMLAIAQGAMRVEIKEGHGGRTELSITLPLDVTMRLTPDVYRGIMESRVSDWGYVYVSAPVQMSRTRSLALLSCGWLKIYTEVDDHEPFEKEPDYSVDLVDIVGKHFGGAVVVDASEIKSFITPEVSISKQNEFECCCNREMVKECRPADMTERTFIPKKFGSLNPKSCGWMIGSGWSRTELQKCHYLKCVRFGGDSIITGKVLCGMPDQISSLQDGIALQIQRFIDAAKRGKPDATWFQETDLFDSKTFFPSRDLSETPVSSPHTEWFAASEPLLWG